MNLPAPIDGKTVASVEIEEIAGEPGTVYLDLKAIHFTDGSLMRIDKWAIHGRWVVRPSYYSPSEQKENQ